MPRKLFVDGEILSASDMNTYLSNQALMVFATAAARTTAIPSPIEGMLTYRSDADVFEFWNGTAWTLL